MNIAVYCGSQSGTDPAFTEAARELGEWIAENGHSLVYGGSAIGLMGVVSSTVMDNGGKAYGVEPKFFLDAGVEQQGLTELFIVETMSERKDKMIELADAFIALPGGVGTLEEISEIMSHIRLDLISAPCILLNINGFYDSLYEFMEKMADSQFIYDSDFDCYTFVDSVVEAAEIIHAFEARTPGVQMHPSTSAELAGSN